MMMHSIPFRAAILCLLTACALPSCSLLRKKKQPQPSGGPVGQATLIGIIEMVNPEQNYVVIRSDTPPTLKDGTELIALGADGMKSKLVLSPERKGHYLTADIKDGSPAVTHLVLLPRPEEAPPAPPVPAPAPAPPTPATTPPAPLPAPALEPLPVRQAPAAPQPQAPSPPATAPAPAVKLDDLEPPVGNP